MQLLKEPLYNHIYHHESKRTFTSLTCALYSHTLLYSWSLEIYTCISLFHIFSSSQSILSWYILEAFVLISQYPCYRTHTWQEQVIVTKPIPSGEVRVFDSRIPKGSFETGRRTEGPNQYKILVCLVYILLD